MSTMNSELSEELAHAFKAVRNSVVASLGHYQIWFTLRGEGKAWESHLDDMNDHRVVDFFRATIIAHYRMMFIEIACLFDSGETSHGIRFLKTKMRRAGLNDIADRFDDELKPFGSLVSHIKTVRSKVVAHKDVGVDEKSLYKKHGIKPNEIGRLMKTTAILMRDLEDTLKTKSSTVWLTDRWENATFGMLGLLKSGRSS